MGACHSNADMADARPPTNMLPKQSAPVAASPPPAAAPATEKTFVAVLQPPSTQVGVDVASPANAADVAALKSPSNLKSPSAVVSVVSAASATVVSDEESPRTAAQSAVNSPSATPHDTPEKAPPRRLNTESANLPPRPSRHSGGPPHVDTSRRRSRESSQTKSLTSTERGERDDRRRSGRGNAAELMAAWAEETKEKSESAPRRRRAPDSSEAIDAFLFAGRTERPQQRRPSLSSGAVSQPSPHTTTPKQTPAPSPSPQPQPANNVTPLSTCRPTLPPENAIHTMQPLRI